MVRLQLVPRTDTRWRGHQYCAGSTSGQAEDRTGPPREPVGVEEGYYLPGKLFATFVTVFLYLRGTLFLRVYLF